MGLRPRAPRLTLLLALPFCSLSTALETLKARTSHEVPPHWVTHGCEGNKEFLQVKQEQTFCGKSNAAFVPPRGMLLLWCIETPYHLLAHALSQTIRSF